MRTAAIIAAVLLLSACTQGGIMMCGVKSLGNDERGITYVLAQCEDYKAD